MAAAPVAGWQHATQLSTGPLHAVTCGCVPGMGAKKSGSLSAVQEASLHEMAVRVKPAFPVPGRLMALGKARCRPPTPTPQHTHTSSVCVALYTSQGHQSPSLSPHQWQDHPLPRPPWLPYLPHPPHSPRHRRLHTTTGWRSGRLRHLKLPFP
jgi:hypothetical protein